MTKLVIFDLDGTLLDTIADLGASCNYALEQCGFQARPLEEYNALVGKGIYNLFRGALPSEERDETMVEKMASYFIPYYEEHKCDRTKPYPGIPELLSELAKCGIRTAVASNKYQEGTEKLVSHFFGEIDFTKVLGQRDGLPIKPDPEIVREIMDASGICSKDEVIYVGDSNVDMETGRNSGVRTIGVTWGFRTKEELESYSPWKIASNKDELRQFIMEQ